MVEMDRGDGGEEALSPGGSGLEGIRILHLSTELGFRGGEQQVLNLMAGLAAAGVEQGLVAPMGSQLAQLRPAGVEWWSWRKGSQWGGVATIRQAVKSPSRNRRGIFHAHTSSAHSLVRFAQIFGVGGWPLVVSRRVDFPVKPGLATLWKYKSGVARFLAISEAVAGELRQAGIAESKIRLVPSGVDPQRFGGFREGPEWDQDRLGALGLTREWMGGCPLWISVAALVDHKDPLTLVGAAEELRNREVPFRLVMAGDGDMKPELERALLERNLQERVLLPGRLGAEDLQALYRGATGFVITSHLEGLGTAVLDAMAVGLPVVATGAGGLQELIKDGVTGWQVPIRRPDLVAEAILDCQSHPEEAQLRRDRAKTLLETRYTCEAMVKGTVAVYREIITGTGWRD
jgi:glycosyltransferase involved in cell wall biosynthesis